MADDRADVVVVGSGAADLPEAANRVTLGPKAHDAHGMPAARVTYRYSANTLRMLDHGAARAKEVLKAAGAAEILQASFVTSAAVNPTSTIGALALRAADGIWEHRREWT